MTSSQYQGSDSHTIAAAIASADTEDEIVSAIALATWHNANDGEECPEDRMPTAPGLAEWFDSGTILIDNIESVNNSAIALAILLDAGQAWWTVDHGQLRVVSLPINQDISTSLADARVSSIEQIHKAWLQKVEAKKTIHPLAPIVSAWQTRPVEILPNTRRDRIMPARLAMVSPGDIRAAPRGGRFSLFSPASYAESEQMALPGFGMQRVSTMPALPLALYDLGMKGEPSRGPAPLALRLWVESILSTGLDERLIDEPLAMQVTLRNLRERLWPKSWRGYNTDRLRRVLHEAANALDSWEAAWPWYDPETGRGGTRRIVTVSDIGNTLDDTLRIVVDLPPGAAEGPQVTPTLGEWGARSADAYRTLLNLAYHWHRPGQTHMPVAGGRYWIRRKTEEAYPELTDDDLLDLVFPTSTRRERRKLIFDARKTLAELEKAQELRLIGKRILPPADAR